MASTPPPGEPVPADGRLPPEALGGVASTPLSIYVHVPFCASRCGYCDFNTYTARELGSGASREDYLRAALAEIDLAAARLSGAPPVSTVFFGGGTPTLLDADDQLRLLDAVADRFGLAGDCEVTTEANPESVGPAHLRTLRRGGITRLSLGMQSARSHVLALLDRQHTPDRAWRAALEAREAGFESVSLDLIYGTPGETLDDWRASLLTALRGEPDHVSAYALIVEDGTRLAARIRRGEVAMTDDDDLADKYLLTEELLTGAGFEAYEVSNWARDVRHRCRHNLAYWRGANWWGIGPGAHSHVGGVRWWNVRHPARYAARLDAGSSPGEGRELLTAADRHLERLLLEPRISDGLDLAVLSAAERARVPGLRARGLVTDDADRLRLTVSGRLLADAVTRELLG